MTQRTSGRLPVTVVTGFLGAGKTTLLRHLLLESGQRLAVLVNEFGEVGIDGDLIAGCGFCPEEELQGRLVELANGCLCCTVQDEFLPSMSRLLERADSLDGIVVETSGLALPEPLVEAFGWPEIRTRTRVHAVVTVVDGEALAAGHVVGDAEAVEAQRRADPSLDHLTAIEDLFADQLEAADLVLISRADRISADQLEAVTERLRPSLRPGTVIQPMARGRVEPELLLDLPASAPGRPLAAPGGNGVDASAAGPGHDHPDHDHDHDHHDHAHVAMETLLLRRDGAWQRQELEERLRALLRSEPILRLKGRWRQPGKQLPLQIQAVGSRLECWYEGTPASLAEGADLELVALVAAGDAPRLRDVLDALV